MMKHTTSWLCCTFLLLSGCALTQSPATVTHSGGDRPVALASPKPPVPVSPATETYGDAAPRGSSSIVPAGLKLDKLSTIAKTRHKNPAGLKAYVGQSLHGQGKFVRTAKGNPNAVVADVRVNGIGEVSIWCRNVLGAPPVGRAGGFDGVLTGEVYTSEDFSNDVYLKDCRFRD